MLGLQLYDLLSLVPQGFSSQALRELLVAPDDAMEYLDLALHLLCAFADLGACALLTMQLGITLSYPFTGRLDLAVQRVVYGSCLSQHRILLQQLHFKQINLELSRLALRRPAT